MDDYDWIRAQFEHERVAEMTSPVRCKRCNGIYDLGTVEVTGRYLDCSVWRTPCCRVTVDSQPGHRNYEELR